MHGLTGEPFAVGSSGVDSVPLILNQPKKAISTLAEVVPVGNSLFASEMHGAVRCKDPDTGYFFDDTRRYIEANTSLSAEDKEKVYYKNTLRAFRRFRLPAAVDS